MMNTERRKKVRLRPKDVTFVVLRPKFVKLGKLLNINRRGLCFQYMAESKGGGDQVVNAVSLKIDLFISNNGYYLPSLPCKLIYETGIKDRMIFPTGLEHRRCGLQFKKLMKKQIDELERYLKNHTIETGGQKMQPSIGFEYSRL